VVRGGFPASFTNCGLNLPPQTLTAALFRAGIDEGAIRGERPTLRRRSVHVSESAVSRPLPSEQGASPARATAVPETAVAQKRFYLPELDGLRCLAFVLIFLRHLEAPPMPSGNPGWLSFASHSFAAFQARAWVGVDLFFFLSAFLITEILLREHELTGKVDVKNFWLRRILRIWPLYYLALILGFLIAPLSGNQLIGPAIGTPEYRVLLHDHFPAFAVLLGNWSTAFKGFPYSWVISPLWSISVEEQFYIFWPLVVLIASPGRLPLVLLVLFVCSSAYTAYLDFGTAADATRIYTDTLARFLPFILGISTCLSLRRLAPEHRLRLQRYGRPGLLAVIGLVGLIVLSRPFNSMAHGQATVTYFRTASSSLLLVGGTLLSPVVGRVFANAPMVWLGKLSYGLYVFSGSCERVGWQLTQDIKPFLLGELAYLLLAATLTVTCAAVSYYGFERPFLQLKLRLSYIQSRPI
jgi:peptidoglycan/LPS O-acetylase OafA/YrhL